MADIDIDIEDTGYGIVQIGTQGPTGAQGPAGPQGAQGVQGIPGIQGPPGGTQYLVSSVDGLDSPVYLTLGGNSYIEADASIQPIVMYLDLATPANTGFFFKIKKLDGTSNAIVVRTKAGQLIDLIYTEFLITFPRCEYDFVSTGAGYNIN